MLLLLPSAAYAHFKWFEEYELGQKPVPISTTTLSLPAFWLGIALVLFFFIATTLLFIALFAVGGTYRTPELKTDSEPR